MSSLRSTASALALILATSYVGLAHAQQNVSDSDRKAARDLYEKGASQQVQGHPAEALDSFMRSYSVFPAPTTALHVAQCQAALGHLVEAEEAYRSLANAKIPDGSPQAFYAAQEQAKTELAQVSPRLPTIRVTTTPDKINGLQVKVDDQPMNAALVGVARAVNPGTHKVSASAPGYAPAEASVTVQEKDARDVPLTLVRGAGPLAGTGTTTATGGTTYTSGTGTAYTGSGTGSTTYQGPTTRPAYQYTYGNNQSGWNAPYSARTKRANGALYGGGIALVVVGSIATLVGAVMVLAGEGAQTTCTNGAVYTTCNDSSLIASGAVTLGLGIAGIVGGAIMISVGGKRVPVTDAAWMPAVHVGPTGGALKWAF